MVGFSGPMGFCKVEQFSITTPPGYRLNAFVDVNSTRLTRMVRAKFADKVRRQERCHLCAEPMAVPHTIIEPVKSCFIEGPENLNAQHISTACNTRTHWDLYPLWVLGHSHLQAQQNRYFSIPTTGFA
jgi:hypothetical protein